MIGCRNAIVGVVSVTLSAVTLNALTLIVILNETYFCWNSYCGSNFGASTCFCVVTLIAIDYRVNTSGDANDFLNGPLNGIDFANDCVVGICREICSAM